jgi:hypothetical protein
MMISTFCSAILLFDGIDIFSQREKGEEERYFYISIYSPSPFSRQTCLCERERGDDYLSYAAGVSRKGRMLASDGSFPEYYCFAFRWWLMTFLPGFT